MDSEGDCTPPDIINEAKNFEKATINNHYYKSI